MKKNAKNETEVHYLFIETKISTMRHKQHSKIHFKFRPWDGRQMVNIKSFILYFDLNLNEEIIKLILTKYVHSDLLKISFKIKIQ